MISMRVVKKPRKTYRCAHCETVVIGEHLYLFGGEEYGKPRGIRVCAFCALSESIEEVISFAKKNFSRETINVVHTRLMCKEKSHA